MKAKLTFYLTCILTGVSCSNYSVSELTPLLRVSENKRYLTTANGDPFFWLGDTRWLLFSKLSREEAGQYFEDRKQKGFNVIQVMVLHDVMKAVNVYGDSALENHRVDLPLVTPGNSPVDAEQYDYWYEALNAPGASQIIYLKNLILSYPYFERVPAQDIIAGGQGER